MNSKKKSSLGRGSAVLSVAALVAMLTAPMAGSAANLSGSSFAVKATNAAEPKHFAIKPAFEESTNQSPENPSAPSSPEPTSAPTPTAPSGPPPTSLDEFSWSISSSQATLVKYNGTSTDVVIPSVYSRSGVTRPVTEIGSSSFLGSTVVRSVTIPNSVVSIGGRAFERSGLESVSIPDSVTSIGTYAFFSTSLSSVAIPDSVTSIGPAAFQNSKLSKLTLSSNLKRIEHRTFSGNPLGSVTIPSKVTAIEEFAFNSVGLTTVTIPASVTTLEGNAFSNNPFTAIYMAGNAPKIQSATFNGTFGAAAGKVVYYKNGATGYSNPWSGYTTATY